MRRPEESERKRSKKWLWFLGGAAVGFGTYLALRHPVKTGNAIARAGFTALGTETREIPWPGGTLTYHLLGRGEEPLVLVHGLSDLPEYWSLVLPKLLDRYRICLPVLPGHRGTSTPTPLMLGHCIQAIDAAMLHAFGGRRVHLAGFSLGGWVSALFAAVASERLRTLTLINPAGLSPEADTTLLRPTTIPETRRAMGALFGKWARNAPVILADGYRNDVADQVDAEVVRMLASSGPPTEALPRISVPTRVIAGEKDRLIALEESRSYAKQIPNAELHVIEGGTHVLHFTHVAALTELLRETANHRAALPA